MKVVEMKNAPKTDKYSGNRYICIDEITGEVLDDAQGWGYKSPQKAYAAYAYKYPTDKQKENREKCFEVAKDYLKDKNKQEVADDIEDLDFQGQKMGISTNKRNEEICAALGIDIMSIGVSAPTLVNAIYQLAK